MSKEKISAEYDLFTDFANVDEENIIVGTVKQTVKKAPVEEPVKKLQKIEDFGEKIGGARKDLYAAYCDLMKVATEEEIEKVPLSKSFPAPNYKKILESGIERWKVDAVRSLRDAIPTKPKKYSWKLKEWAEKAAIFRKMSIDVFENKWTEEEFAEELEKFKSHDSEYSSTILNSRGIVEKIEDRMLIYKVMGHDRDCSALEFVKSYRRDDDDGNYSVALIEMHGANKYKILCYGATKSDAIERYQNLDRSAEKEPREKKNPFKVYSWRYSNYYFIGCKIGKECVEIQSPFEKVDEAYLYMNSHLEELEEKLEKYRDIPYERESENTPRTGKMQRKGDVTPELFQETFGFRGVEFGTWVENDTRQEDLNKAYDALMDMAEVLNLPLRALSLNGSLGLAFGARGRGGKNAPLAHYEPVKVVINLTKKNGSGSLGHEWFHSVDNYFGRKEKNSATSMLTGNIEQENIKNVSAEVVEGFKFIQKIINQSEMAERCKNLDKHRNNVYWTLPEEMAARSFEVYLKSKLQEMGIRNDYLVNYRDEESWEKATENAFKMQNTYPYPTATEMEDIKTAYEYLFDSIRFQAHDKNYELYSASAENIQEMLKESKLLFERELNYEQIALKKMSEEVFAVEIKYFEGSPKLHGRYDEDKNIIYINGNAETSLEWTFWHEAFHIMKSNEPELYEDILKHVESCEIFTSQQIENYRQAVNQPNLKKSKVMEEMLADAFADMKTGRRIVEKLSEKNQSLAEKFVDFTKKLLDGVKKFFKAKEVQEKYPEVALSNKQFKNFVSRVEENICSLQTNKGKLAKNSVGYKILQSPYKYSPKKQKKFDIESAKELTKKYSAESVKNLIQEFSPLGQKNKNYGREILQEVKTSGR
ncbi:MAG: hypothetical protein IK062_06695 [Selenomonadaceae bacterium]|nr:hypothetical protein [Selenomonadaceae bacterium]